MSIVYPVTRLLSEPRIFHAIANSMQGPNGDMLRQAFLDLLESGLYTEENPEDSVFEPEEVRFYFSDEENGIFCITLDNGATAILTPVDTQYDVTDEDNIHGTSEKDLPAVSFLFNKIVKAIEEADPSLKDDVSLTQIPSPQNGWLCSEDGNNFVGNFHLRSDPDKKFSYNVLVVDADNDELVATVEPL